MWVLRILLVGLAIGLVQCQKPQVHSEDCWSHLTRVHLGRYVDGDLAYTIKDACDRTIIKVIAVCEGDSALAVEIVEALNGRSCPYGR